MKNAFSKLVLLFLTITISKKCLSQDSINVMHWKLKATLNVGPPDSVYEANPMMKAAEDLIKEKLKFYSTDIYRNTYIFEKGDNIYIVNKFDTIISSNLNIGIEEGLKNTTYITRINKKKNKIYFIGGKEISDSIFRLDTELNYVSCKASKNDSLFFYKNNKIVFASNLKLNSIYDLFKLNKDLKLMYKGYKGLFENELTFAGFTKIKNINSLIEEFNRTAKYNSKTKIGVFDNFFMDINKKEQVE